VNEMKTPDLSRIYELTIAQAYAAEQMNQTAVFELTFRKMPASRNYIVAAYSVTFSKRLQQDLEWTRAEIACGD